MKSFFSVALLRLQHSAEFLQVNLPVTPQSEVQPCFSGRKQAEVIELESRLHFLIFDLISIILEKNKCDLHERSITIRQDLTQS